MCLGSSLYISNFEHIHRILPFSNNQAQISPDNGNSLGSRFDWKLPKMFFESFPYFEPKISYKIFFIPVQHVLKIRMGEMESIQKLNYSETIDEILYLIETSEGDTGRLEHILETIKNKRHLYDSDKIFLEQMLGISFSLDEEKQIPENKILAKIQKLIDEEIGDSMRLKHIHDTISGGKALYQSDQQYLENQLKFHNLQPEEQTITPPQEEQIVKEDDNKNKEFENPQRKLIATHGTMPKGWSPVDNDKNELMKLKQKIKEEEDKIISEENLSSELSQQRSKLNNLIQKRQQFENKVSLEQETLEKKIREEQEKITTQTKLAEQISSQRKELENVEKERAQILKKLERDKNLTEKDLKTRKEQLHEAKLQEEDLEKQIEQEQQKLAEMADSQKLRLKEQTKLAETIKQKQNELENIKKEYDIITKQTTQEKSKLDKSLKLQKIIKLQEKELQKSKEERQKLSKIIVKEKKNLLEKTKEEKEKLKLHKDFSKQLKKETSEYNKLKQKREKMDLQVKTQTKKIKEKQEQMKKQIEVKTKKLQTLKQKISATKTPRLAKPRTSKKSQR